MAGKISTIEEYIAQYPAEIQSLLQKIRKTIKTAAPKAEERMSWQMPTFWQQRNLIHFAVHKTHIGIYPGAEAMEAFAEDLKEYKTSKGAVQFPLAKPVPYGIIEKMVQYNLAHL